MALCGDSGGIRADGQPCEQDTPPGKRCAWHAEGADRRALAIRGSYASRMRRYLPTEAPRPEFSSTTAIVTWAQDTAHKVLTGDLDPRAAAEARQLASLTIAARAADAQERLVEALATIEHGGIAVGLLARLQSGLSDGKRRPLPPRLVPITTPPEPA